MLRAVCVLKAEQVVAVSVLQEHHYIVVLLPTDTVPADHTTTTAEQSVIILAAFGLPAVTVAMLIAAADFHVQHS